MIDIAKSAKEVFLKYQKQGFINQADNQEWTSLIETIGIIGRRLLSFVILKSKKWKDNWYPGDMEQSDRI